MRKISLIRQQVAQYESETVQKENERFQEIEKSKAALEVVRAEAYRLQEIAKIESANATHKRAAELEQEVEQRESPHRLKERGYRKCQKHKFKQK